MAGLEITVDELRSLGETELGTSAWLLVDQQRINGFADATDDHQWIHVDPVRAAAESPFKTTVAHGFLTLSLVSVLARGAMSFGTLRMALNYGVNRVRFVSPVPAGARIRGRFTAIAVEEAGDDLAARAGNPKTPVKTAMAPTLRKTRLEACISFLSERHRTSGLFSMPQIAERRPPQCVARLVRRFGRVVTTAGVDVVVELDTSVVSTAVTSVVAEPEAPAPKSAEDSSMADTSSRATVTPD